MARVEDVEPRPELARLSVDALVNIIGDIITRPGRDFTNDELDELAAVNAEFKRRERNKQ